MFTHCFFILSEQAPNPKEDITDEAKDNCNCHDMSEIYANGVSAKECDGAMPTTV